MTSDDVQLKIWLPELGQTINSATLFLAKNFDCFTGDRATQVNLECVAETFAEDFHKKGGWDAPWPLRFNIASMNDELLGSVMVERDLVPAFTGKFLK